MSRFAILGEGGGVSEQVCVSTSLIRKFTWLIAKQKKSVGPNQHS